ncbi:MAG: hypothetical protein EBT02_07505 [Planctomycetia bacterium]|nr:hypothetical protein [Planctomycetia bacterium]
MCKNLMIAMLVLFLAGPFANAQIVKVLPEVIELQGQGELRSVFVGLLQDGLRILFLLMPKSLPLIKQEKLKL